MKRTVLVTGGGGYIGAHACKALAEAGYEPVTYDNLSYGHREHVLWGPFEYGDILDRERLDAVFEKHKPDAVMHFAAFAYVGESVTNPEKYYRNNVAGSLSILEAMIRHGVKDIVFSSTCATYGIPENLPISEDSPQKPINPYGRSKLMVEEMLADFGRAHRLRWIALRYFNAAGADEEGDIGEAHDPETHLIPLVLDAASGKRPSVTVFGTDYDTPDGTCVRDYKHVADLASAHVLALKAIQEGMAPRAFNLGNGSGYSVREVIEEAERITGRAISTEWGARREGDPARLIASATDAREILGWVSARPGLNQMVGTAWTWHCKNNLSAAAHLSKDTAS
ncbi:UDP-glucose 4-epimerase GalE [Sulfitobacter sp. JL08]|nr:UDP-glucose 4-epimerase GalE [Sulfitobacter sp. JL08]